MTEALRNAREFATERSPKSLRNVARIADDPSERTENRLRAEGLLLEYGIGKPGAAPEWVGTGISVTVVTLAAPTMPTRGVLSSPVAGDVWQSEETPALLEDQS